MEEKKAKVKEKENSISNPKENVIEKGCAKDLAAPVDNSENNKKDSSELLESSGSVGGSEVGETEDKNLKTEKKKPQTHVSEEKKKIVRELAELMNKKTVMIVSIKSLPCSQFQEIRKKLRGKATMMVVKKSLIDFALEHSKNKHLKELIKFVDKDCALIFSDEDAFELSSFLGENKSPARARIGQIASEDIKVEAGPTDLMPGPDISALSSVGLKPKVEDGKIAIQEAHILVKKGEEISEQKVSVLQKLDITPFKIGLEPVAAFYDGKTYKDIKIDKEEFLEELKEKFARAVGFAVSVDYMTGETVSYILGKAGVCERVLEGFVKEVEVSDSEKEVGEGGEKELASPVDDSENNKKDSSELSESSGSVGGSDSEKKEKKVPSAHELAEKKKETQETKSGENSN